MKVKMNSKILIGSLVFNLVNSISIDDSWKNITQTATIKLPRLQKLVGDDNYKIKVGDRVIIQLGYDDILQNEFQGYVSARGFNSPLEIMCEDEMWKQKQRTVTNSWPSTTLKSILKYLIPGADTANVQNITLTNFRLDHVTPTKALEKLKDEYGIVAYYRGTQLFCGLAYTEGALGEARYHFQKNVPLNEGNLEFKESGDVKIKVRAISMLPNNKKIEIELGDDSGNETTLHFYNLTKAELRKQAEIKIKKLKYTGYRGTLKVFGMPRVTHGMIADLTNTKYPERGGRYLIDGVKTIYDSSGFRRDIELGPRVDVPA
jgi:phage protein D